MKKLLWLTVISLIVMMPLSSFAGTNTISDSDLAAITAQEGVSIYFNNSTTTGFTFTASWGQTNISSITGSPITNFPFDKGGWAGVEVNFGNTSLSGLLTIDVGVNNSNTTSSTGIPGGIALGLKNLAFTTGSIEAIVKVGAERTLSVPTATMTLGTYYLGSYNSTVNGQVIICTH
ncbi:MAG TPA: DUF6160 family protein [Smithella sp.]|nr:DUF6160 family protein [Smithella sp.]